MTRRSTGLDNTSVELDFASCYELIDHADLKKELLLRSFDSAAVGALGPFLSGFGRHDRGLPQMLRASDQLADAYLSIIDRRLMRSGYSHHRYADDLRVLASDWDEANNIIEEATDHARSLGLVLSSEKTSIKRREVIDNDEGKASSFWRCYFEEVRSDLSELTVVEGPYGTMEFEIEDPDDADAKFAAYRSVLEDWHAVFKSRDSAHRVPPDLAQHLNRALLGMADAHAELTYALLDDLVFDEPTRLEHICRYLLRRLETGKLTTQLTVPLLGRLTGMGRQGPWVKLWLLYVIAQLTEVPPGIGEWVQSQLLDRHEIIRAEASWTAGIHGLLTNEDLRSCYTKATEISRPALAAAAARQDMAAQGLHTAKLDAKMVRAIQEDGPLNKGAYQWAT